MVERIKRLFADEEGATMVEYALLLGLIAIVAILALTGLGGTVKNLFTGADNELKKVPTTPG
ncbi:MAG: Flp family type IVb pilin [Armatimonadetes bacterium]|nr:Flp family type IVb pilin [Armatimonadota bacterium]